MSANPSRNEQTGDLPIAEQPGTKSLSIDSLWPTHCGLRHPEQVQQMVQYVREGGFFTVEEIRRHAPGDALINVRLFEDGHAFLHDGHHRTLAIWLGGRNYLRNDEYELTEWRYDQYTTANPEAGFMTPFHPRLEVRVAEFHSFRDEVREIAKVSVEQAMNFIAKNKERYCQQRTCWHISEIHRDITP